MAIGTESLEKSSAPSYARTISGTEICALGCNAGYDSITDLEYLNRRCGTTPHLAVLPIFGVPLTVNEEMTRTLDYGYDYSGSLHYGFEIELHAPFKMSDRVETFVTQDALYDRGDGRGCLSLQSRRAATAATAPSFTHPLHGQNVGCLHQRWRLGRSEASARCGGDSRSLARCRSDRDGPLQHAAHPRLMGVASTAHRLGLHRTNRPCASDRSRSEPGWVRYAPPHLNLVPGPA